MGFSIIGDKGVLGVVVLILLIGVGFIAVTWLLAAARDDRAALRDDDGDSQHFDV